jgi:hypothetical protein
VICSEIRSSANQVAPCFCICAPHPNEIPHTDPLVQVDYVRVVDLDIGASKLDAIRVVTIRLIAKEQYQGRGFESLP